jgi:hypothetical protein
MLRGTEAAERESMMLSLLIVICHHSLRVDYLPNKNALPVRGGHSMLISY